MLFAYGSNQQGLGGLLYKILNLYLAWVLYNVSGVISLCLSASVVKKGNHGGVTCTSSERMHR